MKYQAHFPVFNIVYSLFTFFFQYENISFDKTKKKKLNIVRSNKFDKNRKGKLTRHESFLIVILKKWFGTWRR